MGILLLFALGGLFGYASSRCGPMRAPRPLLNTSLAIIASLLGGLWLAPRLGFSSLAWQVDWRALVVAGGTALLTLLGFYCIRRYAAGSV